MLTEQSGIIGGELLVGQDHCHGDFYCFAKKIGHDVLRPGMYRYLAPASSSRCFHVLKVKAAQV